MDVAYYRSNGKITGWWLTPAEAAALFAERACEGTLEEGFAFYGGTDGRIDLVGTTVIPHPIDTVPDEARAELEARARTEPLTTPE